MIKGAGASLEVKGGPNNGMRVSLENPILLGRRADNDLVVHDSSVSRRHALIVETPTGFVLRDLNTTNGTFVNRNKIGLRKHLLRHGDRIRLAGSKVTINFREDEALTVDLPSRRPLTESILLEGHNHEETRLPLDGKVSDLFKLLVSKKATVVSREEIARHVWSELPLGSLANREIEEAVGRIRDSIEDDSIDPTHLIAVGEFGFLLV